MLLIFLPGLKAENITIRYVHVHCRGHYTQPHTSSNSARQSSFKCHVFILIQDLDLNLDLDLDLVSAVKRDKIEVVVRGEMK